MGNKPGIDARFEPPYERLAYTHREPGGGNPPWINTESLP
jgi:hypothetical protein